MMQKEDKRRSRKIHKDLPPIIPDNQNWYCVQSSCGDVLLRTLWRCQVSVLGWLPGGPGVAEYLYCLAFRGGWAGNKHLAALPASKDAVSPSLLSCILYPGGGGTFLVIEELYQGSRDPPGPTWTPQWTPKWTLQGKFQGNNGKKGPGGSLHGPKSSNFYKGL